MSYEELLGVFGGDKEAEGFKLLEAYVRPIEKKAA